MLRIVVEWDLATAVGSSACIDFQESYEPPDHTPDLLQSCFSVASLRDDARLHQHTQAPLNDSIMRPKSRFVLVPFLDKA